MAVLVVGSWMSRCGRCGRDADPHESGHYTLLGYGTDNGKPGCMAKWDTITSEYSGEQAKAATKAVRPDLPYVEYEEAYS